MSNATVETADSRASSWKSWLVCMTAALFFFFVYMQLNVLNVLGAMLERSFHISSVQIGEISSGYFITDVLMLFPAGILLDRYSPKRIMLISMGLAVLSTVWFALSHSMLSASLSRLLLGAAGAFTLLGCVRIATRWFPPRRLALVIGLVVTFAMIGGMCAQTPLTISMETWGWRYALLGDAAVGGLMWLLIAFIVQDNPPGQENLASDQQHHVSKLGFWKALRLTISNSQNWYAGIYACLVNIPVFILGAAWGIAYLVQAHSFSRESSSVIIMMLFVGLIVGCPVFGWLSDKTGKRRLPMIIGAALTFVVTTMLMYSPHASYEFMMLLFFAIGFIISAQIIAYPLVAESNPPALTGMAEGLASVLIMSGGFAVSLFPLLLNRHWHHVMQHGVPFYSSSDYGTALVIMPIASIIALFAAFLLRETNCKNSQEG